VNPAPQSPVVTASVRCSILAVFTAVLLARLWLIRTWGSPVPFWDEWGLARSLFLPWLDGSLDWHHLFATHNEHRPALTRLLSLALFVLNDHVWPIWPELYANAVLHATCAALLTAVFSRPPPTGIPPVSAPVLSLGIGLLFAVPAGWQNALWGFQSQVYLASLLSLAALAGLLCSPVLAPRWWLGLLAATLALFTQGSGVFAVAIAFLVTATFTRSPGLRPARRADWIAMALLAAVLALGVMLRVHQPSHDPLAAQNPAQFLAVFTRCLGWPWVNSPLAWLILQAPLVALAVHHLRQRSRPSSIDRLAFALGLLVILHAGAVAYSRAAGLPESRPLSRYQDPLLLGVAAQLYALLRLVALSPRIARPTALAWTGLLAIGLLTLTTTNLSLNLPYKLRQSRVSLAAVRAYLATRDPAALVIEPALLAPHPDPVFLRNLLDDQRLQALFPREFFSAPALTTASPSDSPASVPATATPASTPRTPSSTSTAPTPIRVD
jgi:hypothetical protein